MLRLMEHAYSVGHELALHDAVILCHDTNLPLPGWALADLAALSEAFIRNEKLGKKRGRHAVPRTEQEQLVSDARCYATVNEWRQRKTDLKKPDRKKLRGEDSFTVAARELHLERETIHKAYYRHRKRVGKGTYYISLLYCQGDYVGYLLHNEVLLGW